MNALQPICSHLAVIVKSGEPKAGGSSSSIQKFYSKNGKYQLDLTEKNIVIEDWQNNELKIQSQPIIDGILITADGKVSVSFFQKTRFKISALKLFSIVKGVLKISYVKESGSRDLESFYVLIYKVLFRHH